METTNPTWAGASLAQLCELAGLELVRDARVDSPGFVEIELASRLVFATSERFAATANATASVAAVLVGPDLAHYPWEERLGVAVAADPARAFVELHNRLAAETDFYGAREESAVDPSAVVHPRAHVDERDVVVGPHCRLDPGAVVLEGARLGPDVHVMPGAVIGSNGFQSMRLGAELVDLAHAGRVEIGRGTTVMANAVVARAVFRQATRIGEDCRIGNTAFVSHNCRTGPRCLIGHGVVVAGNTTIGRDVVIGPGATCINTVDIGDDARISMGSVVTRSVAAGQRVTGNFAIDHARFIRALKEKARAGG